MKIKGEPIAYRNPEGGIDPIVPAHILEYFSPEYRAKYTIPIYTCDEAVHIVEQLCHEWRQLDLPHGSHAYLEAQTWLNLMKTNGLDAQQKAAQILSTHDASNSSGGPGV